jgi:hypothetical protein
MLGSRNLWGDSVQILKTVYDDVPTDEQLRLARSSPPTVAFCSAKTVKTKKSATRKKVTRHNTSKSKKKIAKKR